MKVLVADAAADLRDLLVYALGHLLAPRVRDYPQVHTCGIMHL